MPLNFQLYFVIGAVRHALRLSALESIGTSNDAKQPDGSTPLTGRQPKPDEIPGGDQMPKNLVQWQGSIKTDGVRLGKPGSGVSPALFW